MYQRKRYNQLPATLRFQANTFSLAALHCIALLPPVGPIPDSASVVLHFYTIKPTVAIVRSPRVRPIDIQFGPFPCTDTAHINRTSTVRVRTLSIASGPGGSRTLPNSTSKTHFVNTGVGLMASLMPIDCNSSRG